MERDALATVANTERGGEIGFVPRAGLQPVGEKFGTIFDPVSQGQRNNVVH